MRGLSRDKTGATSTESPLRDVGFFSRERELLDAIVACAQCIKLRNDVRIHLLLIDDVVAFVDEVANVQRCRGELAQRAVAKLALRSCEF